MVRKQLLQLRDTMKPRVTISMYTEMPAGQYGLSQIGPGTRSTAVLPAEEDLGRHPAVLVPPRRQGEIDNDLVVCLGQGENPVAAHSS